MAAPIRVGLIGLSASATGTGWATTAHLPYLLKSPHFKITALLNSSVSNAEKAIEKYNLGPDTRAYGSPEDLAQDPNVDLVVVSTRVDRHGDVQLPSLKAGKDVFCEWPLEKSQEVAKKLVDAAKAGGGRTVIGLQARQHPAVKIVKGILESGRIGPIFSSTVVGVAGNGGGVESTMVEYTVDRKVGGHILSIQFGHVIDYIFYTLGEPKSVNSILANQRHQSTIVDRSTNPPTTLRTVPKTTPDQVLFQAELDSGAVLSFHMRGGGPMPSSSNSAPVSLSNPGTVDTEKSTMTPTPQFIWRIYGEIGEIEVTAAGMLLNVGYPDLKIRVHDHKSGKTEEIDVPKEEGIDDLPNVARNIGRIYDRYAEVKGVKPTTGTIGEGLVDFEQAYERHRLIDSMLDRWDSGQQGWHL